MRSLNSLVVAAVLASTIAAASAQTPDNSALKAEQGKKMEALDWLHGEWRGNAVIKTPTGELKITQTERIGPMLDGGTKVVEGRGYTADGKLAFNALAVITYNSFTKKYEIHSFNDGRTGVFPLEVTADGYNWQTPAGQNATIQYVVTFKEGVWTETGTFVMKDMPPRPFIEMRLRRIGQTNWPSGSSLGPK